VILPNRSEIEHPPICRAKTPAPSKATQFRNLFIHILLCGDRRAIGPAVRFNNALSRKSSLRRSGSVRPTMKDATSGETVRKENSGLTGFLQTDSQYDEMHFDEKAMKAARRNHDGWSNRASRSIE